MSRQLKNKLPWSSRGFWDIKTTPRKEQEKAARQKEFVKTTKLEPKIEKKSIRSMYDVPEEMRQAPFEGFNALVKSFDMLGDKRTDKLITRAQSASKARGFLPSDVREWYNEVKRKAYIETQLWNEQRETVLGRDLSAAHFLVARGGRVLLNNNEWYYGKRYSEMPNLRMADVQLLAIEWIDNTLLYEGTCNLMNLNHLTSLNLRGSKYLDDWGIDNLSAHLPALEHFDISDCELITERAMECLYRLPSLKKLVITNHYNSPNFELCCLLLEDAMPGLEVEMKQGAKKMEEPSQLEA